MKLLEEQRGPNWIVLQLLEKCNLRCSMCYEWGDTGMYHHVGGSAELELPAIVRAVSDCLPGRPFFEFFGGEPLLYSGLWDLINLVRQAGCQLAFPTNGTLVEH